MAFLSQTFVSLKIKSPKIHQFIYRKSANDMVSLSIPGLHRLPGISSSDYSSPPRYTSRYPLLSQHWINKYKGIDSLLSPQLKRYGPLDWILISSPAFFGTFIQSFKKVFFLICHALNILPPPLLVAGPLKKEPFLQLPFLISAKWRKNKDLFPSRVPRYHLI